MKQASLGLNEKNVIAYIDTTRKSLFKTEYGSIFISENSLDTTYDYAKHLEFKNIDTVEVTKKQLLFHMKNGKTVTVGYEDPHGVIRGMIAARKKMYGEDN